MAITKSQKNGLIPKKNMTVVNSNYPEIPKFNLANLNLLDLSRELQSTLNSGTPFFLSLGNRKLRLEAERQEWMIRHIENLGVASEALARTQAKLFFSQQLMENLIRDFKAKAEREWELAERTHFATLHGIENAIIKDDLDIEFRKETLKDMKSVRFLNELRTQAEVNLINAKTNEAQTRVNLMQNVVNSIDLDSLPDYLKTFIIASVFNPNQQMTNEMELMDDLKEFAVRKADAETRKMESQANVDRATADKTIIRLKTV